MDCNKERKTRDIDVQKCGIVNSKGSDIPIIIGEESPIIKLNDRFSKNIPNGQITF